MDDDIVFTAVTVAWCAGMCLIAVMCIFALEVWARFDSGHTLAQSVVMAWRAMR